MGDLSGPLLIIVRPAYVQQFNGHRGGYFLVSIIDTQTTHLSPSALCGDGDPRKFILHVTFSAVCENALCVPVSQNVRLANCPPAWLSIDNLHTAESF